MVEGDVEVVRENQLGSMENLKKAKVKTELIKDIIMTALPVVVILLIVIVLLVRWLF